MRHSKRQTRQVRQRVVSELRNKRDVLCVCYYGDSSSRKDEDACGHLGHASAVDNHGRCCAATDPREKLQSASQSVETNSPLHAVIVIHASTSPHRNARDKLTNTGNGIVRLSSEKRTASALLNPTLKLKRNFTKIIRNQILQELEMNIAS